MKREQTFNPYDAKYMITGVLNGLNYLHNLENPIIHNDITNLNIMSDLSGKVEIPKIIDFGYARYLSQSNKDFLKDGLNPFYQANESFNKVFSVQSDVFAVGALYYHLLFGLPPWFVEISKYKSDKIKLEDENFIRIKSITDSDNDKWTEVPYLAQDTVFEQIENNEDNSTQFSQFSDDTPYLLQLNRVPKRFITKIEDRGVVTIQFGAGISANADEEIIPNPDNVGSALYGVVGDLDQGIDPSNFLYTKTYGVAPSNTTLTVEYLIGNGIIDNVPAKDLVTVISSTQTFANERNLDTSLVNFVRNSIAVTNPEPARGARSEESMDEIRNNAMSFFAAQNRTVSREDYIMRCYALPPQFGSVAKAYILQDYQIENKKSNGETITSEIPNPLALNLYTLGYNDTNHLVPLNTATKNNLKTYISYYRLLTDAVNIKDAHIINIGIEFEITVMPDYNSNVVLLNCINELKEFFNINNMSINNPIQLSKLYLLLDGVDGVQTVIRPDKEGVGGFQIFNKFNGNYSPNKYSIKTATKFGVIYPAKDPSIFEVKFPNTDIRGKVVTQSF